MKPSLPNKDHPNISDINPVVRLLRFAMDGMRYQFQNTSLYTIIIFRQTTTSIISNDNGYVLVREDALASYSLVTKVPGPTPQTKIRCNCTIPQLE